MNSVRARLWRTKPQFGSDGKAVTVVAAELGRGVLPVSLAQLVNVNALACDLRKVIDQGVRDGEIALLTSYVAEAMDGTPLTAHYPRLIASSRHIRSFVSECTGLGVMSAVSEALFEWKPGKRTLNSFDILPRQLKGLYGTSGPRPDLLFHLPAGPMAGEARGRSRSSKMPFPVASTADQRSRMATLANWSKDQGDHAYFMSWVWIGPGGVVVDVFLPDDDTLVDGMVKGWMTESGGETWIMPAPRPRERPATFHVPDGDEGMDVHGGLLGTSEDDSIRIEEAVELADAWADSAMNRLFERSPATVGTVAGVPVRGQWIQGDRIGPATHEVLVGVLAEGLPVDHRARRRAASTPGRLDAFLDGRLLTVARRLDEDRPAWDRITEDLLNA
ncbi:hypothetical protein [Kitasatospora sp. NPDC085879]|uniref:hypothetical protein n=1 Tax=Kitasatospora sp. NPDC085879 TaxID=3154769 RepID=UPI00344A63F5